APFRPPALAPARMSITSRRSNAANNAQYSSPVLRAGPGTRAGSCSASSNVIGGRALRASSSSAATPPIQTARLTPPFQPIASRISSVHDAQPSPVSGAPDTHTPRSDASSDGRPLLTAPAHELCGPPRMRPRTEQQTDMVSGYLQTGA